MEQHAAATTTPITAGPTTAGMVSAGIPTPGTENASPDDSEPPGPIESRSKRYSIAIANEQLVVAVEEQFINDAICYVLADNNQPAAQMSVALVDDAAMRPLNRQFLEHDYTTDVLSFKLSEPDEPLQGELIVNAEIAQREAAEAGWSVMDEILLYVVHGTLHLVGHCDKSAVDAAIMKQAERTALDALEVQRSDSDTRWLIADESAELKSNSTGPIPQRGAQ